MNDSCSPIENRNFLSPNQFKLTIKRCPKASFFSNSGNIPSLTLGIAKQANYLKTISQPGDMIEFQDFIFKFLVDEDLTNYLEIQNWIRGLSSERASTQASKQASKACKHTRANT